MAKRKRKGDTLLEAIEDLENRLYRELEKIFLLAQAMREEIIERPISYDIDPELIDLVVDRLANIIIDHYKKKDLNKALKESFAPLFKIVKPEMERIWPAIKKVGFSGKLVDAEAKWRNAALECFDDSKKGFEAIKREYLEDETLYLFTEGKEKRDFEGRLLRKIIERAGLGTYGGQKLRNILCNS